MMRLCASAAELRGGGPILNRGWTAMFRVGLPPPRIVIGGLRASVVGRRSLIASLAPTHATGRKTTPSGTPPIVAKRHRPITWWTMLLKPPRISC